MAHENEKPEDFDWNKLAAEIAPSLDVDTAAGDVRDALLSHIRVMTIPWSMLSEQEQMYKIDAVENIAKTMVRGVVRAIAEKGFPHVEVVIGKIEIDKGLKLAITASNTMDNITKVASHGKMGAVLVLSEVSNYLGERSPAKPDKDQSPLPLDDGEDDGNN